MIEILLLSLGILLLFWLLYSYHLLFLSLGNTPEKPESRTVYPSVSIIRPIKGLDVGVRENIRSAFNNGYPGWIENIFVFDDEKEPALPIVREEIMIAKRSKTPVNAKIIYAGNPAVGYTGKMNAMMRGLSQARGELVAFADSDIRPNDKVLKILVDTLMGDANTGSAFAPVRVENKLKTSSDSGHALLLNGLYTPVLKMAASKRNFTLPFIMGQFMIFKREALEAIGGLEVTRGQLVDDMYIGECLNRVGLKNRMISEWVPIIQNGMTLHEFWKIYRKWITFSRSGLPGSEFKFFAWMEGVGFWVGLILSVFSALLGFWLAAATNVLPPIIISLAIGKLHELTSGVKLETKHLWTPFAILLTAPFVYLSILFKRKVEWRGRSYELDGGSRLATDSAELAGPLRMAGLDLSSESQKIAEEADKKEMN